MSFFWILRRVALVKTDVSEERSASIIRVYIVFHRSVRPLLVTANAVPSSAGPVTLMTETLLSFEISSPTRAIQSNIPEDGILYPLTFKWAGHMTKHNVTWYVQNNKNAVT
jgi:hypothetical protein